MKTPRQYDEARAIALLTVETLRVMARPKNRAKGDWSNMGTLQLLKLASAEIEEARREFLNTTSDVAVMAEIGDAAAYLAMALDNMRNTKERS